jgi:hypothetical protein
VTANQKPTAQLLGVRRWGEDITTPVVADTRHACNGECIGHGCIGLEIRSGWYALVHLTSADALRLSDLLRAMAETNTAEVTPDAG